MTTKEYGNEGKMKEKPVVGQELWSLNVGNAARGRPQKLTRVVVKKVGRKYFTAGVPDSVYGDTQYHIGDWREKSDYSPYNRLYITEKEYLEEVESESLSRMIGEAFKYGNNTEKLSLEDLRKIHAIINPEIT